MCIRDRKYAIDHKEYVKIVACTGRDLKIVENCNTNCLRSILLEGNGYYLLMNSNQWKYIINKTEEIDQIDRMVYNEEDWISKLCYQEIDERMKDTHYKYEVRQFELWLYEEIKELYIQFMLALTIRWTSARLTDLEFIKKKFIKLNLYMRKFYWSKFRVWMDGDIPGFVDVYNTEEKSKMKQKRHYHKQQDDYHEYKNS